MRTRIERGAGTACVLLCAVAQAADTVPQYRQEFPQTDLEEETRWAPCAYDLRNPEDRLAECAYVNMPLDYAKPEAGKFRVLVKRVRFSEKPSAQVWLLHGGPGASATADLHRLSYQIPRDRPDIHYYAVDHRGMGGSERLVCPTTGSPDDMRARWASCAEHLKQTVGMDRLMQVTMSNAARDIGTLAGKYREPGARVIVLGLSYGTTLAHRYMQIFPDQPDGVVWAGVQVGIGGGVVDNQGGYDRRMNKAIEQIFVRCSEQDACVRHFAKDPWEVARNTMASLYEGHCPALGIEPDRVKSAFGDLSYSTPVVTLPSLIYRLNRCNEQDVGLIRDVVERWRPADSDLAPPDTPSSYVAGRVIGASEKEGPEETRTVQELKDEFSKEITIAIGDTAIEEGVSDDMPDPWITYPPDEYYGKWPDYDGPLLMLQGGLDTATPLPRSLNARGHFAGMPYKTWVVFAETNHRVIDYTPTVDGDDCARSIFIRFIDDPKAPVDKSCIARMKPTDWSGSLDQLRSYPAGGAWDSVDDMWGDVPKP